MTALDPTDLRLRWPRDAFVDEARSLVDAWGPSAAWNARAVYLLTQAFAGSDAYAAQLENDTSVAILDHLVAAVATIPYEGEARAYFSERHGVARDRPVPGIDWVKREFARTMTRYHLTGCLGEHLQPSCPDNETVADDPSGVLHGMIGLPGLWPLEGSVGALTDNEFFDVVEALGDLVVIPRERRWHGYGGCSWHYDDFRRGLGRRVYRFDVNRLFERGGIPYRIAGEGPDAGDVVAASTPEEHEYLEMMTARQSGAAIDEVSHAVELWRHRGATRDDKRSAVVALARVLETHRSLLKDRLFTKVKDRLFTKDEARLFEIANEFDLRHSNERQRDDYDPLFLDWIFRWYLATIELVDGLLARPAT